MTAAIGITAEGGEFAEIVKKCFFQGKPFDEDAQYHAKRELGDIMWYIAQACIALDITMDDVIETNIEKLEARYPGGFDAFSLKIERMVTFKHGIFEKYCKDSRK